MRSRVGWRRATGAATQSVHVRQVTVAALLAVYALAFLPLYEVLGPTTAALSILPVAVAGSYFGVRGGVAVPIILAPIHHLLFLVADPGSPWDSMRITENAVGTLAFILMGVVVGRMRDLNDQVRRELAERRRAERQLEEAQRIAHLGTWTWHLAEDRTEWSAELYRIFGMDSSRGSPNLAGLLERVHPHDRHLVIKAVERAKSDLAPLMQEVRVIREDGAVRHLQVSARVVADPLGNPLRLTGTAFDITELKATQSKLEELVRSKDEFLAAVSHELRTPLTGVMGFAQILAESGPELAESERSELIEMILRQARDVANLVDDLLVAARMEIGQVVVLAGDVDLQQESYAALEAIDQAATVAITGHRSVGCGDPARVRQIIRNLVANARRYGGDEVSIQIRHDDDRVELVVADDGEGVPPYDEQRIFEPYQRSANAEGRQASVGLGLSVSRDLARRMKGDLWYERVDGWTRFVLALPLRRCGDCPTGLGESDRLGGRSAEPPSGSPPAIIPVIG